MTKKDIFQIVANFAVVGAMVFSGIALLDSKKDLRAQQQSQQAILFHELESRISQVFDNQTKYVNEGKVIDWYVQLFNAFEYYTFFANRNYLPSEMKQYGKAVIVNYYGFANEDEDVRDYLSKLSKEEFSEVRKYYKEMTGTDPPF